MRQCRAYFTDGGHARIDFEVMSTEDDIAEFAVSDPPNMSYKVVGYVNLKSIKYLEISEKENAQEPS